MRSSGAKPGRRRVLEALKGLANNASCEGRALLRDLPPGLRATLPRHASPQVDCNGLLAAAACPALAPLLNPASPAAQWPRVGIDLPQYYMLAGLTSSGETRPSFSHLPLQPPL